MHHVVMRSCRVMVTSLLDPSWTPRTNQVFAKVLVAQQDLLQLIMWPRGQASNCSPGTRTSTTAQRPQPGFMALSMLTALHFEDYRLRWLLMVGGVNGLGPGGERSESLEVWGLGAFMGLQEAGRTVS